MRTSDISLRVINFTIDTIVLMAIISFINCGIYFIYPETSDVNSTAFDILYFATFFSYYFLFEALTGKTVGKLVTKTMVVNRNGSKPTLPSLIVRTLMRLIPFDGLTFILGSSGLHDLISKTTVTGLQPEPEGL
jgi:uncharacterized RDD family membrane protein YckC